MNLLDLYLRYVEPLKGSAKYHRWSLVTCVAALLERRVWIDRGRLGVLFPNLYTILVGPPAAGKSTTAGLAVDLLRRIRPAGGAKPIHFGPTKITQAALYQELKEAERRVALPAGQSAQQSPLMIFASELAINMTDFGGGTLTNELIDFYDSRPHTSFLDKRTVTGGLMRLFNPSITLLGCTTQSFLQQAAQEKLIVSGLASRIVFIVENERVEKQREYVETDSATEQNLLSEFGRIYATKGPLTLDANAHKRFIELATEADDSGYSCANEAMQNYFGRKPDHLTKLAACFASMKHSRVITTDDLNLADAWLREIEPAIPSAFGIRSIAKEPELIQYVLAAMPFEPQWILKSELIQKLAEHGMFVPQNGEWTALLKGLIDGKMIRYENKGHDEAYQKCRG